MKKNVWIIVCLTVVVVIGIGFGCYHYFFHTVPDVLQKEETVATQLMDYAGFKYEIKKEYSSEVQKGYIVSQSVEGGTSKMKDSTITLVVSRGEEITIPDFSGMSYKKAKKLAKEKKLKLRKAGTKQSKKYSTGRIVDQDLKAGAVCEEGTEIQVIVSSGSTGSTEGGYSYQPVPSQGNNGDTKSGQGILDIDDPDPNPNNVDNNGDDPDPGEEEDTNEEDDIGEEDDIVEGQTKEDSETE